MCSFLHGFCFHTLQSEPQAEESDAGAVCDQESPALEGACGYTKKSVFELVCGAADVAGVRYLSRGVMIKFSAPLCYLLLN